MQTLSKTRRIGGSLVVTIPKRIVEQEGLIENETVTIEVKKVRRSFFGITKGKVSFSKEDKLRGQLEK
ncbi:hypothetical protein HYY69_01770 [Candidatus Woesearchaeota archaeon]|nr:hypothetical protein [Candidatus Woesearchaeota archaeon]